MLDLRLKQNKIKNDGLKCIIDSVSSSPLYWLAGWCSKSAYIESNTERCCPISCTMAKEIQFDIQLWYSLNWIWQNK